MKKALSTKHLALSTGGLKVAIVHDWLVGGGAERVVEQLHLMFPDAPIYTSFCNDEWRKNLDNKVVTGYLQHWPFSKLRKFLPVLRALWFSNLKLNDFDLVISSSGAEAKGIKLSSDTLHVNYCHSPTHYYWIRYDEYMASPGFGALNWLARIGLKLLIGPMRRWDYKAAQRPNVMIANSNFTKENIKRYYGRDAEVIHPPVNTDRFQIPNTKYQIPPNVRRGFVVAGRQTPYMRKDLAVIACTQLDLPLKVIGRGPDHDRLVKLAGPNVEFLTNVSDLDMPEHFQQAEAFIMPGMEDFGITPVEAMAAGTPVIAFKAGGALDYVEPGKTGEFFDEQTVKSLVVAIKSFDRSKFDSAYVAKEAYKYNPQAFTSNINLLLKNQIKSEIETQKS